MLENLVGRNSISRQIRIIAVGIGISSALILAAVIDQAYLIKGMMAEHESVHDTDKKISDFNRVITDVRSLSMALASTGNSGPDAIERQIELFEKVNAAGSMGASISNVSPQYAEIISPYELGTELGEIANQVMEIEPSGDNREEQAVVNNIELATVGITERVTKLAEEAKFRSIASQRRIERTVLNVILTIIIACGLNFAACLFMARHLVKRVADPAKNIAETTEELAGGNLDVEVPKSNLSELKAIANALEKFRDRAHREREIAMEDPISALPNRRAFIEMLEENTADVSKQLMLAYIDVDRFKDINDGYGHGTGDALVKAIGQRLKSEITESRIIARVGGDEFAMLLCGEKWTDPEQLGKMITKALVKPFMCDGCSVAVTASVGITRRESCQSGEVLMQEADIALYHAKANGRDQFAIYSDMMAAKNNHLRRLERDLPNAIHSGQLRMVYQPILSINSPDALELEALVRWQHPDLGNIPPDIFIGIAEKCGLINSLGRWIMDRVFSDMRRWPKVKMSINLSTIQLKSAELFTEIVDKAKHHGITPQRVEFEITESLDIENSERAILTLGLLRASGFRIALDDFGSGYSSLSFIKEYPLDRIKLDRSLLHSIGTDGAADAVVEAAIALGSRLNLEIVAEGVEKESQVELMRRAGCSHLQGYYFSRPLEANKVTEFLDQQGKPEKGGRSDKQAA